MFIEVKVRGNERRGKEGKEGRKRGGWKKDEGRKRRGKEGKKEEATLKEETAKHYEATVSTVAIKHENKKKSHHQL